jgi:DNA (cytosine-5)-methyltransferase 1
MVNERQLVLSLFPGIGLLDMAFEAEGFCVVRGPDLLWGGDVKTFHPPSGRFDGVIGGPPCQAFSTYSGINRHLGNRMAEDLTPEFARCVAEAQPAWWLMENVPKVPGINVPGYITTIRELNSRWLGEIQHRHRVFQFGSRDGRELHPELAALEHLDLEPACLASEARAGRITNHRVNGKQKSLYHRRRDFDHFCELQGLPAGYLAESPFTVKDRYRVVGNGVPLPMGRAIARAVRATIRNVEVTE